ncbi:MAG: hypothetical protein JW990_16200, partial [Thermoleophilia bacterium]|nr:hypothetical protein [Thermoleophilia bacterium]
MSIPRVLLVPTHRTGLADAVAAAAADILTAGGRQVRYHHVGPIGPAATWDRWEGTAFIDPALYSEEALFGLYDVATRGAEISLLSSTTGVLDRHEDVSWVPADVARLLDCPMVVLVDCRGWGSGIRVLTAGLRSRLSRHDLAGVILSGVAGRDHLELLKQAFDEEDIAVAGCLFADDGPGWDTPAPGAWGQPLQPALVEAVARQVDLGGLVSLAGQRGFLPSQSRLTDRGSEGPLVAVAGCRGFTPWSRDSIEVLRAAGAQIRRLDLLEDISLPEGVSGLVLAGTLWSDVLPEIALNTSLLGNIRSHIERGLPTVALGGGMLLLLSAVQDLLGRTSELAGVVPVRGEILWEFDEPSHVELTAGCDTVLLAQGETVPGWVLTDAELIGPQTTWQPPFEVRTPGADAGRMEGVATDSL